MSRPVVPGLTKEGLTVTKSSKGPNFIFGVLVGNPMSYNMFVIIGSSSILLFFSCCRTRNRSEGRDGDIHRPG